MPAKLLIFVIIPAAFATLISTAISSSPVAFAAVACFLSADLRMTFCTDSHTEKWTVCTLHDDGTETCETFTKDGKKAFSPESLPPDFQDAKDIATEEAQSNDTKPLDTGALDDGTPLTQGDTSDDNDDTEGLDDRGGLDGDDDDAPTINPRLP